MLKNTICRMVKLQKNFTVREIHKSVNQNKLFSGAVTELDIFINNPVLAMLVESFQRYGYVKVASYSRIISPELNNIITYLEKKPINWEFCPNYLNKCTSYEEVISLLTNIYSNDIGVEFLHLNSTEEKHWISERFVRRDEIYKIDDNMKIEYLKLINRAENFDLFLAKKFQSVKRYSGEGVESIMVLMKEIFTGAANLKMSNLIISMAHRCRNNMLTTLLMYPPVLYFRKMMGFSEFPSQIKLATGDTFSHFFHSIDYISENGFPLHISLIPNPSHLEANIPVGAGKVRSKMLSLSEGDYSQNKESNNGDKVMGIFIHGDASVYGQGVVSESLVMTDSPNFSIGGGIHIVINNQLGFTTETPNGIKNVTDISKIVNSPIIHVNAYKVIDVARAAMLAVDYRNTFRKDIFINLLGFRRWGHNELDDPTITQPFMYSKISAAKSISQEFYSYLMMGKLKNCEVEINEDIKIWEESLNENLQKAKYYEPCLMTFKMQWADQNILDIHHKSIGVYNTGIHIEKLKEIGKNSVNIPENFKIHQNVYKTHIQRRLNHLYSDKPNNIDWATAEALAIGSLLSEGKNCRISGQDVGRGTFSQRHFILINQETNECCIPFNICTWKNNVSKPGYLEVANSILSEEAVLGFEIGMALDNPNNLCIWEAQFGDFFNGAQILIDTYLGSSEVKWMLQNGLVLLLPHGYDGAGPEHSSCRLERFLQLTDSSETECDSDRVNVHVINPTTPAQYFHALRRQIIRPFRKPLVILTPKLLLRSPDFMSSFHEFQNGTFFRNIISDNNTNLNEVVKTILLCSGKHYFTLKNFLQSSMTSENQKKYIIIRIEQLTPFPISEIYQELIKYKNAKTFIWCQEEARNMGAWQFVSTRIKNLIGINLEYAGRKELAVPAVGIMNLHKMEIEDVLQTTLFKINN